MKEIARLRGLLQKGTSTPWRTSLGSSFQGRLVISIEEGQFWQTTPCEFVAHHGDEERFNADTDLIIDTVNALPVLLDAADLLARLDQWDALNPPVVAPYGDAPFWKREIEQILARLEAL